MKTMTQEWADDFARDWIEAWNAHDLERVLSHYTLDFEMSSPFITNYTQEPSGTLRGRDQIETYWRTALERLPHLHFELLGVLVGVGNVCLFYKTSFDKLAAEVLFVNESRKVYQGAAHYGQP